MARTEEQIKRDVVDHLYWDNRVDASDVTVQVSNGTVTLRGTVPTYFAATSALNDAWTVLGVTDVRNNVTVRYPREMKLPTDEEIRTDALNVLARSPDITISDLDIEVDAGRLTVDGSVDSYWKKTHAEDLVGSCPGVISIHNRLTIVPDRDFVDRDIANDIQTAIDRNALVDADDVTIRVRDGRVTLSGTVPTYAARRAANNAALFTAGVRGVINNTVVSPLTPSYP
jgi:osmotically-inducible protein OsmY